MKKLLSILAAGALFLAGCQSTAGTPVTPDEAPTDLMKNVAELNNESMASDVVKAVEGIINATAEKDQYRLKMDTQNSVQSIAFQDDQIESVPSSTHSIDYRLEGDKCVYELLEQESDGSSQAGLMKADAKNVTTAYAEYKSGSIGQNNLKLSLSSVETQAQSQQYDADAIESVVKNTVVVPLYGIMGGNLILQPFSSPEYYDFSLTKNGSDYILTISIKDQDAYNKALDDYFVKTFGYERKDLKRDGSYMAEEYTTSEVTITVTMDEDGVISKITNDQSSQVGQSDNLQTVSNKQTMTVSEAPETLLTSMADFFKQVDDKEIKNGSDFEIRIN